MNELEDILNYLETTSLEPHGDYTSEFSYKEQKILWSYIKELQQENQELKKQLEEKENQQKEFIENLKQQSIFYDNNGVIQGIINNISNKYKEIIGDKDE